MTWRPEYSKNISVCESLKKLTNEDPFDNMPINVGFLGKDESDSGDKPCTVQSDYNSGPTHKPMKTGKTFHQITRRLLLTSSENLCNNMNSNMSMGRPTLF